MKTVGATVVGKGSLGQLTTSATVFIPISNHFIYKTWLYLLRIPINKVRFIGQPVSGGGFKLLSKFRIQLGP